MLQANQSNINGDKSGNKHSNNNYGYNNTFNFMGHGGADSGVQSQGGVFGAGEAAPRDYPSIPYRRNSDFTGRKSHIKWVKRFSESKGHRRVALHGLGGSGKTQIALEFVYQRASENNCDIFWVQGSDVLKFSDDFRAIAQHVQIPLASAETDEARLLEVKEWFEDPRNGNWILVIDNADNEADFLANNGPITKFIPKGINGTLIFTTRSRQVASQQGCEMIEVGKMGEEEALELFSKYHAGWDSLKKEERKHVAAILDLVDHLPIAVIGSAAYMSENGTRPSRYKAILLENEERMKRLLSHRFHDIQREVGPQSILGTYFVTFDQIRQQMPLAADLLRVMAFFNHQDIPEELLAQCGPEGMDHSANFRCAIGKLVGFSLVRIVEFQGKTFYQLDRLVQLSLKEYLPTKELNKGRATALKVISRLFPQPQDGPRDIDSAYIPHALAATKDSTDPIAEELGFCVALHLLDIRSYDSAEIQFRGCTALREGRKE